jgi:asparagine synthase (glutamine-hydrolysing)
LICAIASKYTSSPLKTFNIGFEESKFDESLYAKKVANLIGTDHTEYRLSEKQAIDLLEKYLVHFDEPFADTSAIPTMLVSKLARQEVKVVLTGDGGDELFQGYGAYSWANKLATKRWKLAKPVIRKALRISGRSRFERIAELLGGVNANELRSHIFSQEQYFFSQDEIKNKVLVNLKHFRPFHYQDDASLSNLTEGEKQAFFDILHYLKDDLLVKVDRASMYSGLECRSPLLDYHVVEFAVRLSINHKVRDSVNKWLLKDLLRDFLPEPLVHRPKWGFSVPLSKWMKGDLRYLIDEYLNTKTVEETGFINVAYVEQLKTSFFSGKEYLYNRLWVLIALLKWLKENG